MRSFLALLCLLLCAPAWALSDPDDAEGITDHPEIPRYPGYWVSDGNISDFNSHEFTVKRDDENGDQTKTVEGRYWYLRYAVKEGVKNPSALALARNYENAIKQKGGTTLWKEQGSDSARATFKMSAGKSSRWMQLSVYDEGRAYEMYIVEEAGMEQQIELSASQMLEQLDKNGFVALYGIHFDTGKDVIKPESEALLNEIVSLMSSNAGLKLSVEGHTDNVGDKKSNEALSKKRAESVKKWLVGKGVDAKRLASAGHGDSVPVADNRLEEGRAKNRRVELVKAKK